VPEQYVDLPKGRGAFLDCVRYLTHEDEKQQELGKTLYPDDVVVANFDWRDAVDNIAQHRMTAADTMRLHVLQDGWTLDQCEQDDPLTFSKIEGRLQPLRVRYLQKQPPSPLRINIYVEGEGGVGKSAMCQYIAQEMFRGVDNPAFWVGADERVTFDGYDGQPVIIWDDWRVGDFIKQFRPQGTYKIFDPHPKPVAQQAKYSRVILTNAVNIINGVQPYDEFIAGLAGTYKDRDGFQHMAEDDTQAWRRFPMILCVRTDDFDILLNKGFVNNDMSAIKTMLMYANVRCSFKNIMHHLEGEAREKVLVDVSRPVLEAVDKVKESQNDKISDPALIPPEFADYGKVTTHEELVAEAEREGEEKARAEQERLVDAADAYGVDVSEAARYDALHAFGKWFWKYGPYAEAKKLWPSIKFDEKRQRELISEMEVKHGLDRFIDGALVATFSMNEILDVVEKTWTGELDYDLDDYIAWRNQR
jgi:hypothetical protein